MLLDLPQAVDVVHVVVQLGDFDHWPATETATQSLEIPALTLGEPPEVAQVGFDPAGEVLTEHFGQAPHGRPVLDLVYAVHHHTTEGQPRVQQPVMEVHRLIDRVLPWGGHEEERRVSIGKQLVDALGTLAETLGHFAEAAEELRQVVEQVDARSPAS